MTTPTSKENLQVPPKSQAASLAVTPSSARVTFDVDDGLEYIATSPTREHGGFHPLAVETAQAAIAEISRLRQIVIDVHEMAVQSPYFGRIAPRGAAKVIAEIAAATDQPFPPGIQ